jgi:hypothetical protein
MNDAKDMPKDGQVTPAPEKARTDELSIDQLEQCVGGLSYHGTIPDFLRSVVDA